MLLLLLLLLLLPLVLPLVLLLLPLLLLLILLLLLLLLQLLFLLQQEMGAVLISQPSIPADGQAGKAHCCSMQRNDCGQKFQASLADNTVVYVLVGCGVSIANCIARRLSTP
jgi:hypothetical protein